MVSVPERDDDDKAVIEKQMLILAQNLLIFGEQRHAEGTGRRRNTSFEDSAGALLDAFVGVGDRNFRQAALGLISASGLLTDALRLRGRRIHPRLIGRLERVAGGPRGRGRRGGIVRACSGSSSSSWC